MALPGLSLPPHFVFRKNVPRMLFYRPRNLFFVPICHLHTLTHACKPHAAGREPWLLGQPLGGAWALGPADPLQASQAASSQDRPWGSVPSSGHWGCATGEGHGFPPHRDRDALQPTGRSSSGTGSCPQGGCVPCVSYWGLFWGALVSLGWASRFLAGFASQAQLGLALEPLCR